jgi:hypothetical protein
MVSKIFGPNREKDLDEEFRILCNLGYTDYLILLG